MSRPAQAPLLQEHGFEKVRGLPSDLPPGEQLLWQGAPQMSSLAVHAFHVRKVAVYLLLLIAINGFAAWQESGSVGHVANTAIMPLLMTAFCLSLLCLLAWVSAKTTVYSLTNRRFVLRIGMALPVTINLPFKLIHSANLRVLSDGTGDLPLELVAGERIDYLMLWPHARRWYLRHPQPTLRSIAEPERVAELLRHAVARAGSGTVRTTTSQPQADWLPSAA